MSAQRSRVWSKLIFAICVWYFSRPTGCVWPDDEGCICISRKPPWVVVPGSTGRFYKDWRSWYWYIYLLMVRERERGGGLYCCTKQFRAGLFYRSLRAIKSVTNRCEVELLESPCVRGGGEVGILRHRMQGSLTRWYTWGRNPLTQWTCTRAQSIILLKGTCVVFIGRYGITPPGGVVSDMVVLGHVRQ